MDSKNNDKKKEYLKHAILYDGGKFSRDFPKMYHHAARFKYLPELNFALFSIRKKQIGRRPFSDEQNESIKKECLLTAKKYSGNCFVKDHSKLYYHAVRNKYLTELHTFLPKSNDRRGKPRLSDEENVSIKKECLDIAEKYRGVYFAKDNEKLYTHAYKNKYLPELRNILNKNNNISIKTQIIKKENLEIAKKYTEDSFTTDFPRIYGHAFRHKYVSELNKILRENNVNYKYKPNPAMSIKNRDKIVQFILDNGDKMTIGQMAVAQKTEIDKLNAIIDGMKRRGEMDDSWLKSDIDKTAHINKSNDKISESLILNQMQIESIVAVKDIIKRLGGGNYTVEVSSNDKGYTWFTFIIEKNK